MDRRDTIKSLFLGSVAAGLALNSCSDTSTLSETSKGLKLPVYGRTEPEKKRDSKLVSETFFTEHELLTIATLSDIILPKNSSFGSATDAGVPEFIEFIVKDMPYHQTPIRGGVMWLDAFSNRINGKAFIDCTESEQLSICDQIAFPNKVAPELQQGASFFSTVRNLTMTGYFTSKMGIEDLGYKGNSPTVWDGVPEEVLKEHGLSYDKEWLDKCVDQSKRGDIAQWDENGNLIS